MQETCKRQAFITIIAYINLVRFCAFPGCEKKMKRNIPETYHRLPFDILNLWLLVLQVDINTPTETLRLKDLTMATSGCLQQKEYQRNRF